MSRIARSLAALAALVALVAAGCTDDGRNLREPADGATAPPLVEAATTTAGPPTLPGGERLLLLLTPTMTPEGPLDVRHTCDGAGVAPALSWTGVPFDAVELAIIAEELDDDSEVLWLVAGLDPAITGVAEGRLPTGATTTGGEAPAWTTPCPAPGESHTIVFTLYVLGEHVDLTDATTVDEALSVVQLASTGQAAATTIVAG